MSYDFSIGRDEFNMTYNLGPMFYKYDRKGIRAIYGMTGACAVPFLRGLRVYFEDNEADLRKLEPENGWGDFDGALDVINRAIRSSLLYPSSIWEGD